MFSEIFTGIWSYILAVNYFVRFRLYKYLLLLILLLLIFAVPVVIFDFFFNLIAGLIPYAQSQKYALLSLNMIASLSGFFLLLVLSPLFSLVSEEVGKRLIGQTYRFSPIQLGKDIIRGVRISLRNMFYQYLFIGLLSIGLYFLPENPILQVSGQIIIALVTAYFYGFSILDYAMENYRMPYRQSVDFVHKHSGLAIGLGGIYYLIISLNDLLEGHLFNEHTAVYWSSFSEAFVAFLGVIAASVILFRKFESRKGG